MYTRHPSLCPRASTRGDATDGCTTYVFPGSATARHRSGEGATRTPTPKLVFASFTNHTSCQKSFDSAMKRASASVGPSFAGTHSRSRTNHVGMCRWLRPAAASRRARRLLSSSQSDPGHPPTASEKAGWSVKSTSTLPTGQNSGVASFGFRNQVAAG